MAAGRGPIPKDPRDLTSCPNVTEGEKTRPCPGRGLSSRDASDQELGAAVGHRLPLPAPAQRAEESI